MVDPGSPSRCALQYGSYACLIAVTVANRRLPGALVLGLGMLLNLVTIVANGGHMPATASALHAVGKSLHGVHMNSVSLADPRLPWLVDRFATPRWVPFASIFSVGDVLIVVGAGVILWSATGAHLPRRSRRRSAAGRSRLGRWAERHPVAAQQRRQLVAIDLHVGVHPVAVGLASPRGVELVVVGAGEALVVPDHVSQLDVVAPQEPGGQVQ